MNTTIATMLTGLTIISASVTAAPVHSLDCEEALALSALPARLRDGASVYALTENGYVRTRDGSGPFTCIVERNHPLAVIPQCVDAAGADTIIPALIFRSERALEGATPEQVLTEFRQKAERGEFHAPSRPGISYMTSAYNYIYLSEPERIVDVHPHLMFYAPNLTNEDIGGSFKAGSEENRGLPFVLEPGIHGYMISFVDHASESEDVQRACAGEVADRPPALATARDPAQRTAQARTAAGHQH
jgi:hypothetical protein